MSESNGLTKVEILWTEIIELSRRLDEMVSKIVSAESTVGNTVTSLEETMAALLEKMVSISNSADGVLSEKQAELNKLIELAMQEAANKAAQRDLDVVEMISEGVELRLKEMQSLFSDELSKSIHLNSMHIQAEASKHLMRATNAIDIAKSIDKAVAISIAIILVIVFGACAAYGGWHLAFLHYANSSKQADAFITTPEGKAALEFSRLNDVNAMLDCKGFNTTKQAGHTYCLPLDAKRNVSGWRID
ncbi:hypothetical protein [Methylovorus glucosotrophus]|uniref:Uncharacterized protein n=1 Tax=Methylovorus glucosotrophus (strain SIP3-4) TaxID=582744 RepID=C6XEL9_METGS|nr:hypothetical protein [Methylovorus glucosotrophus]ACT52076.1 hypothetical protein Msip34_2852 [Methylovorus glucosotrophus SIP3-4]